MLPFAAVDVGVVRMSVLGDCADFPGTRVDGSAGALREARIG